MGICCSCCPEECNKASESRNEKALLIPRIDPQKTWYHGDISYSKAEKRCANTLGQEPSNGTYLVFSHNGCYHLYVYFMGDVLRFNINSCEKGLYLAEALNGDFHDTMESLISHYHTNGIKVKNKSVKLKTIVPKPTRNQA